jgi:hypothetical protein
MKTKFFIFSIFAVLSASVHAQSAGEVHNQVLAAINSRFENGPVNFSSLYSFASQYASEHNLALQSFNETKNIAVNYIVGKNNDQMLSAAKANNVVSKSLSTYIEKVVSEINKSPDENPDVVSARLNTLTTSGEYQDLSRSDKKLASDFNDVLARSYQFWYDLNASKKCRVGCYICIAVVDAFWTAILGPVGGAVMSAASRCCGCGDCGSRVNCS